MSLRRVVIGAPLAWLLVFFLLPCVIVARISLAEPRIAQPPYSPLLESRADGGATLVVTTASYRTLIEDELYLAAYFESLRMAALATLVCLLLGYPMAWRMARAGPRWRAALLLLVMLPFWTSFLLRVYAWSALLNRHGVVNELLLALGIVNAPLELLHTPFAVQLGLVYAYLPFMILPLYATLERLDEEFLEAAADLGCPPWRSFVTVVLPLSLPGVLAGCALVFVPALGEFVVPDLLGGPDTLMIGKVLWDEFFANRAWPVASAIALIMLALVLVLMSFERWLRVRVRSS
ncbi:MAG: ABC transporter permease subunit [Gammaproteobacteria bacterium]